MSADPTASDHDPRRFRSGGLAAWSIRHPVGVVMLTLGMVVLGAFAFGRLAVDLLPHIIYPEIGVRVLDRGVPAKIMEDKITRQLEEQLAITEDAISIQSRTSEGRSALDLSFKYGTDINLALRDASSRLDRAKRFLPDTIDPPVIFKRDPSQLPAMELVVSSKLMSAVQLRSWVDYVFAKWFINLPGVASAEVGGGLEREIQVLPDQQRLAGLGLSTRDVIEALQQGNLEEPSGRVTLSSQELAGRTDARFRSVADVERLPIPLPDGRFVHLSEVADVVDTHVDERLRVTLDSVPGIKVTIQKQPSANTMAVVEAVNERLAYLHDNDLIPEGVSVDKVSDQSVYIRSALQNASSAALLGAALAMAIVYLFLGNVRRTLIIGSAIPIAVMVTFLLMDFAGLTLNIMTLGGLAVGIGMLVDNTIVMLENIYRHQRHGERPLEAGTHAAAEVNSAIVASTSTNLAAILPFLFISGLVGLLFRELIITVSAAIVASMVVALTLTPALATRVPPVPPGRARAWFDRGMERTQNGYARLIRGLLARVWLKLLLAVALLAGLVLAVPVFYSAKQDFLPAMDDGEVTIRMTADPGVSLDETQRGVDQVETLIRRLPGVVSVFTTTGGFVFGRSEYESRNKATLKIQLVPVHERKVGIEQWMKDLRKVVKKAQLAGFKVRVYNQGIRGIRVGRSDDDISLRVQGPDPEVLDQLGEEIANRIADVPGIRNVTHSSEERRQELAIKIDRERAASLGLTAEDISTAVRVAIDGEIVTEYIDGDRSYDIRVRLPHTQTDDLQRLDSLLLVRAPDSDAPIYLGDVARVELIQAEAEILRDNQARIVEISASISGDHTQGAIAADIDKRLAQFDLPAGYSVYSAGITQTLQEGRNITAILLGLALFLVFVVMAVQYESLRNPLVILLSVPFASIGVALGLQVSGLSLSMPVWLGMIMLAGIVVNNAIVLVEYIELQRERSYDLHDAICEAARLRLRPILMTTLTTVAGLLPLALALGEGAEMLQPLAVTIVSGLSFSLLVSLLLVPIIYEVFHFRSASRALRAAQAAGIPSRSN